MDPDAYPHHWINRLGFMIRKQLVQDFAAAGHDVTAEEWAVLLIVQARPGQTASALSARSFRDKTTVTRMVDRLAAKGLSERRDDPGDRRVQRLYLTDRGARVFSALAVIAKKLIARSLDGINADETRRVTETLRRMAANLDARRQTGNDL